VLHRYLVYVETAHQRPLVKGQLVWIKPHGIKDLNLQFATYSGSWENPTFFQQINMDTFPSSSDFTGGHAIIPGQPAIVMGCRGIPFRVMPCALKSEADIDLNIYEVLVGDLMLQIFGCDLTSGPGGIFTRGLGTDDKTR